MSELAGVEVHGANVWAVSAGEDELTVFTLLDGPGIDGIVAPRGSGEW